MNASRNRVAIGLTLLGLTWILAAPGRAAAGGEDLIRQQAIASIQGHVKHPTLPRPPSDSNKFRCLPTCNVTDGRFLAIAGKSLQTLSPPELTLQIAVPAGSTSFQIGFFDGDSGATQDDGTASWDAGVPAVFEYTLWADPLATGSTLTQVELEPGVTVEMSDTMPDNQWADFIVPTGPEAASPSGNFFYVVKIRPTDPSLATLNALKVRTSAVLSGLAAGTGAPFSFLASWTSPSDLSTIYPAYPDTAGTTYDGTFRFYFDVPVSLTQLAVWDGDFDHGNADLTDQDTDDPDTPGAPFLPAWAMPAVRPEGIALGANGGTGDPADDMSGALAAYIVRPPAVRYDLLFPDGRSFANDNPSGNLEWEQLMVSTAPFDRTQMDFHADSVPPGTYELRLQGLDMQNLGALLVPYRLIGVDAQGVPAALLRPFLAGGSVFSAPDLEAAVHGIPGVTLELHDWNGALLATTVTGADGSYSFGVEPGEYEIVVAAANFADGGPLAGYDPADGDRLTDTVSTDNVLTYDFAFHGHSSIGNRVWYDINGNGIQDPGEVGMAGVILELRNPQGTLLDTTATGKDGQYGFRGLVTGTYVVDVVPSSLVGGTIPTFDPDGVVTPNAATIVLASNQSFTDADFGYRGAVCLVDPEFAQVQVVDTADRVVATVTAAPDGSFTVHNLPAGTYKIRTVPAPAPAHR